jgi:hypothetical protein
MEIQIKFERGVFLMTIKKNAVKLSLIVMLCMASLFSISCEWNFSDSSLLTMSATSSTTKGMVDVLWVSGPSAPTSTDITIDKTNFAPATTLYFKVRAYSNLGPVGKLKNSLSDPSYEQTINLLNCSTTCSVHVAWAASTEPSVNRSGGGYLVYFNKKQNFKIK